MVRPYVFRAYTGIGSRSTPEPILEAMEAVAEWLADEDWTLRSGAADGADTAFEKGAIHHNGRREIYLPWAGFNNHGSRFDTPTKMAYDTAAEYHPNWKALKQPARLLMARNGHQVLGKHLNSKSLFVLCWTPNGQAIGGTSQAIRIARHHDIPVINLGATSFDAAQNQILEINEKTKL